MMDMSVFDHGCTIPFTETQLVEMCRIYKAGKSARDIGVKYGISEATVRRKLRKMNVNLRPNGQQAALTEMQVRIAAKMRLAGNTILSIATVFKVSETTIRESLKRYSNRLRPEIK